MPQISRQPLQKDIDVRIRELLDDGLARLSTRDDIEQFLSDLLTPTEKVMLSKRLAIAMLLQKGYNYREISEVLKVSTSTVRTVVIWRKVSGRGYQKVIDNLMTMAKWNEVLTIIETMVNNFHHGIKDYQ